MAREKSVLAQNIKMYYAHLKKTERSFIVEMSRDDLSDSDCGSAITPLQKVSQILDVKNIKLYTFMPTSTRDNLCGSMYEQQLP